MKEKTLAVSKRDQKLLSILLAFVLVFLCYYFVAGPAFDNGLILTENLAMAEQNLQKAQALLEQAPKLEAEVANTKKALTEKYSLFLYRIDEAGIFYQLDGLMTNTGFAVNGYQQTLGYLGKVVFPTSSYIPNKYTLKDFAGVLNPSLIEADAEGNTTSTTQKADTAGLPDTVEQMDLGIGFQNAGYDAIYRFLTAMEGLERSYIISELIIVKNPEGTGLNGQILVRAISLPKIDEADAGDLVFLPATPKGRPNPF